MVLKSTGDEKGHKEGKNVHAAPQNHEVRSAALTGPQAGSCSWLCDRARGVVKLL